MKVPFNEAAVFKQITQEEEMRLSWLQRKLGISRSTIRTTEDLAKLYKKPVGEQQQLLLKPFKLSIFLPVFFSIGFIPVLIANFLNPKVGGFNHLAPFVISFMAVVIIGVIIDKIRYFRLLLSKDGITIREVGYRWEEIYKIYFVTGRKGKAQTYFLIFALDTGTTARYEVTSLIGFKMSQKKLAANIEHYKKSA